MGRAPCCEKVGLKKGKWTEEEDEILTNYINAHGEGSWRSLPKKAGLLRCGKSCRLRWINYLRAGLKRGNFSRDEEELIIKLHHSLGNRWSQIASELPGRTDNDIKNYWNSHLSRSIDNYHQLNICKNTTAESTEPPLKSSNKNSGKNSAKNAQTTTKTRKKKIVGKALNPQTSSKHCNEEIDSQFSSLSDEALWNSSSDCFNRPFSPKIFDILESEPIKATSEFSFTADECSMSMDEIIIGPSSPDLSSIFNEMDNLLNSEIDETNVEHGDKNMLGDIMDDLLVQIEAGKEEEGCLEELRCLDFLWDSDEWPSMRFVEDELVLD